MAGIATALRTTGETPWAQSVVAGGAAVHSLWSNTVSASRTGFGRPFIERDVRTAGVVVPEHLPDENEEIEQPPVIQSAADLRSPVPFAEAVSRNVWVWMARVGPSGIRVECNHAILIAPIRPRNLNQERSEFDLFEFNRFSRDCQHPIGEIELHGRELASQAAEVVEQVPHSRDSGAVDRVMVEMIADLAVELIERARQLCAQPIPGQL